MSIKDYFKKHQFDKIEYLEDVISGGLSNSQPAQSFVRLINEREGDVEKQQSTSSKQIEPSKSLIISLTKNSLEKRVKVSFFKIKATKQGEGTPIYQIYNVDSKQQFVVSHDDIFSLQQDAPEINKRIKQYNNMLSKAVLYFVIPKGKTKQQVIDDLKKRLKVKDNA
jgi:hypothetical protein